MNMGVGLRGKDAKTRRWALTNQDAVLADAVVALGVGVQGMDGSFLDLYHMPGYSDDPLHPEHFVHDWRVAGALMERLPAEATIHINFYDLMDVDIFNPDCTHAANSRAESLPRAIIEACAAALQEKSGH